MAKNMEAPFVLVFEWKVMLSPTEEKKPND